MSPKECWQLTYEFASKLGVRDNWDTNKPADPDWWVGFQGEKHIAVYDKEQRFLPDENVCQRHLDNMPGILCLKEIEKDALKISVQILKRKTIYWNVYIVLYVDIFLLSFTEEFSPSVAFLTFIHHKTKRVYRQGSVTNMQIKI